MTATHKITNPAPNKWNVYDKSEYDAIVNKYDMHGAAWFSDKEKVAKTFEELSEICIAVFPRRKDARAWVEKQGGSWK